MTVAIRLSKIVDSSVRDDNARLRRTDSLTSESTPQGAVTYGYGYKDSRLTSATVSGQTSVCYSYDIATA